MFLDGIPEVAEVIGERDGGQEAEEEFAAEMLAFKGADNRILEFLIPDEDVVFNGKCADSGDDMEGVDNVHAHDAGKDAEKVAERDMRAEPLEGRYKERIEQNGVQSAENRPNQREERADDPLVVSPTAVIVPQLHLESENEDLPGNQFDQCHSCTGQYEYHADTRDSTRVSERQSVHERGDPKKCTHAEAVDRQIRTVQKSRIYPLPCDILFLEPSEKQLQRPSGYGAQEKQKRKLQE